MSIVLMVQVTIDEIVDVIAMRHRFMPTAWTMYVIRRMAAASVSRSASVGILGSHFQRMFFDNPGSRLMVQVPIVQIVDVVSMNDWCVPTRLAVDMIVFVVSFGHCSFLFKLYGVIQAID